ncbi:ABC transporter ATP-binding protein [Butyrivibrio sp. WCD2001]|uniref:ABC transporter ATP-binding protein n=1 Tax=Butyrivibrio sp. WCD2001 TaxID=1280681 RepID=UPI00047B24E9|nr:ABC transporter ATP-binding protein [Butyrivibrio sp. WCD2001]
MMKNIVDIKNVSFHYKGSDEGLLKDVSLKVKEGETLLLCGASGSGKTTLIRLINGLIPHYYPGDLKGCVKVAGKDISKTQLYELAGIVGTVFQNPRSQFFSVDTDGEIVFGPENIGLEPSEIKKRAGLVTKEMTLENLLGRSLFELSGGEKQKIACASVSALLPEIILLDEPSSNLDWSAIDELRTAIQNWKKQGKTIVISEHRLWYLKDVIDRVIYMEDGDIAGEWQGKEFFSLSDKEIKNLKLRPVRIEEKFIAKYDEASKAGKGRKISATDESDITLKDFYFTYKRRPYLFRKKKLSQADGDILSLNIPELSVPKGAVIGVIGKNGTGKSTFLRCVCGLENECRGSIITDGAALKGKKRIGISYMVMQDVNHQLFTDSVEAEVLLSMKNEDKKRCDKILDSLGLLEYKDKHPMALSGGQKQRVAIASAIAADARLLLFDEPTSGLDYSHMVKVSELLRKLADSGRTVLVSTHDPELIELCCDYVLCINNGKAVKLEKSQFKHS